MMAACVVLLPVRFFGGHEKMLVEWLREAIARHDLQAQVYSARNERLIAACEAAGIGRPVISHPAQGGCVRDFFITWRLLGEVPRDVPVLLAPSVLQVSLLQWLAAFLRRRHVVGYVAMAHSSKRMRFRGGALRDWIVRHVVQRVDAWITISDEQQDLLRRHWGIERPIFVVPNRVAPDQAAPAAAHPAGGPLRVLFIGRFDANQKGLDWLCERLRARRGDWTEKMRFTFQGEGGFGAALSRLSADLGTRHVRVSPWGGVAAAMAEADVLLVPSRYEGVPLVALEAVHHGVAVVATRSAGLAELLPPSCLFDFGDDAALWAALGALEDPAKRAATVAYARKRLRRLFSPTAFHTALARVVAALASPATQGARP